MTTSRNVLSIAGSDPSGGAGIQADLKTFAALGAYGMSVITALTAQNTRGVKRLHVPPVDFIVEQIDAIFDDIDVAAVKTGMLATPQIVRVVAERLRHHRARFIVIDPVLVATSGDPLGTAGVAEAIRGHLFPIATLVTPNFPEAARLLGESPQANRAAQEHLARKLAQGGPAVLVKGGHIDGTQSVDILAMNDEIRAFTGPRIDTRNTHGTGCTLSSAIATRLAQGAALATAIAEAKDYLNGALQHADELNVGGGSGPVHHGWRTMS